MATLDLGSGSGQDTLEGIVGFLDSGGSATRLLTSSFLGVIVSPFVALADIIDAIGTFFAEPFESGGIAVGNLFDELVTAPADLVGGAATISQNSLSTVLGDSLAGIFALPIAIGVSMIGLYFIAAYLNEEETGDTIPGLPIDVPTDFLGVEEESTADE